MRSENDYWARRNNPRIPKYKYFLTNKGSFLTGFLPRVVSLLKRAEIPYKLEDNRRIKKMPDMELVKLHLDDMEIAGNKLRLRDYQLESLIRGFKKTRGIYDMATGAGKTVVMAALIKSWRKNTLVVINSKDLAYQLQGELEEYMGEPVGFIGDGRWEPETFTVAIDKTLVSTRSKRKKKRNRAYLESIEYLIFDEVHHAQSATWRSIAKMCKRASLRHGFSGTPETSEVKREDGSVGNQDELLEGYLGPTIHRVTAKHLIDEGWLARPVIQMIENEVYFDNNPLVYVDEYMRIIAEDEWRNNAICQIAATGVRKGEQTIGFIDRVEHGETIHEMLRHDYGLSEDEVAFVHGKSYSRDDDIEAFKQGDLPVLFGTVLSEGLNFFCDNGINCAGGKSSIDAQQRPGRILRKEKTETGETVNYYDFIDSGHPYFSRHARKREKIYRREGHEVKSVKLEDILN
jgi:superfamily II DNA or RNA helicase